MLRAHCCQKPLRFILQASLAAALCGTNLAAETFDYAVETRFSGETIKVVQRETTLARVLWMISAQTGLQWDDLPLDLPLTSAVVLEPGSRVSLAQVFVSVSAQVPVVFVHRGDGLMVRLKRVDDVVVLPGQAVVSSATPGAGEAVAGTTPTDVVAATPVEAPAAPAQTPDVAPETPPLVGGLTLSGMTPILPTPGANGKEAEDSPITLEKFTIKEAAGGRNSVIVERRQAMVATEVLSSSDFSKFIATDVADISVRMPGISTTSKGTFAVVRGLAERYNPVMLDGIVLPSTDPERQSPELDIFPTRLVDAIVISKTFEPRLPGTASGAGIDLRAKPLPQQRFAQIQFGLKADEAFFKGEKFLTSGRVGIWDYFAHGAKDRVVDAPEGSDARLAYIRSPNTVTRVNERSFPLGSRFALTYEDRILVGDADAAFGYGVSFGYDRSASSEEGEKFSIKKGADMLSGTADDPARNGNLRKGTLNVASEEYAESELETRFGFLGNLGYAFNKQHQIGLSAFWSQIGIDEHAESFHGLKYDVISYSDFESVREATRLNQPAPVVTGTDRGHPNASFEIYYRQRQLYNVSLRGEHDFGGVLEAKASWVLARVGASQIEPEYLYFPYFLNDVTGEASANFVHEQYTRYWRTTNEASKIGRVDFEGRINSLLEGVQFKAGIYVDRSDRRYEEQSITASGNAANAGDINNIPTVANRDLLADGIQRYGGFLGGSGTADAPAFAVGDRSVDGIYLSSQFSLLKERPAIHSLDLLVGARLEAYSLNSNGVGAVGNITSVAFYFELETLKNPSFNTPDRHGTVYAGAIDERKLLPAVAINYSPMKSLTLRMAFSKTTARPSFREVGSYFTIDRLADEYVHGNKDLRTSDVSNLDLRVEYFFPKSKDLVAFSVFKKDIRNPIERFSIESRNIGLISTFANNANDAELRGMEFEFAKSLKFIGGPARWFSLGGNATFIDVSLKRDPVFERSQIASVGIEDERPLYDQPKWIANANTTFDYKPWGFSTTLTYFAISEVLQKVNTFSWDTYTAQRGRWDLSLAQKFGNNWQVRFSASNLADPDRKLVADPSNTNEEVVYRRYKDGRSYSLSVGHDF